MILVIMLLSVNVVEIVSNKFLDERRVEFNLPLLTNDTIDKHTIVYCDDDKHNLLIKTIITRLSSEHTVLVIRGAENVRHFNKIISRTGIQSLVLIIKNLNINELDSDHFKVLLNCFWSPVYLMWGNPNTLCRNGTFDSEQLLQLKHYLNAIWQMYRVTRVMVLFPYDCPNDYVIYGKKEMTGERIYKRGIRVVKTNDMKKLSRAFHKTGIPRYLTEGYPLKANIFIRFPTSVPECDTVSKYTNQNYVYNNETYYCGLDGMVFYDFMTYYKFNLSRMEDKSCDKYGILVEEENIVTGALKCIVNKDIDISFNSRFMVHYGIHNYTYMHYVSIDSLCAILKRKGAIPLWHYAHNVFTPLIWAVLLTVFIFIGILTWISAKIISRLFVFKPLKCYTYVFSSITTSFFGFILQRDKNFLLIKSTSLVCSIMILAMFQGHVNYMSTTKAWYPRLKTFDDLRRSAYTLHVSPSIHSLLINYVLHNMANKLVWSPTITIDDVLVQKSVGTVDRKEDLIVQVLYNYTDSEGIPLLDFVDECFYTNYLAYIANIDFIFVGETHNFMMRLLEAGLPHVYYIWTRRQFLRADKFLVMDSIPRPYDAFCLADMRTVFGILAIGYIVSLVTFLVEVWKGRHR